MNRFLLVTAITLLTGAAHAQSSNNTCLPVLQDAVQALKDSNAIAREYKGEVDRILNTTIPSILAAVERLRRQVESSTQVVSARTSTGYLTGVIASAASVTVGIGVAVVWGGAFAIRKGRTRCCAPEPTSPTANFAQQQQAVAVRTAD